MAGQPSESDFFKRLASAANQHAHDETVVGGMELPAGIKNGVARLVDCRFTKVKEGSENAGQHVFYAAGVVLFPDAYDGQPIVGLRTSITEPMYDTLGRSRETFEQHVAWVQNVLRAIGADPDDLVGDKLTTTMKTLAEVIQPTFHFRTYQFPKQEPEQRGGKWFLGTKGPYPTEAALKAANKFWNRDPMVNHAWGAAVDWAAPEVGAGVVDNGKPVNRLPAQGANNTPARNKAARPSAVTVQPEPEEEVTETGPVDQFNEFADGVDLDALAAAADGEGDLGAVDQITAAAKAAGLSDEDVGNAPSYADVVTQLRAAQGGGVGTATEPEPEPLVPKKGNVYLYRGIDPRTKKPARKPTEHECVGVSHKAKTCDLKNLDSNAVVKGVAFAELEGVG